MIKRFSDLFFQWYCNEEYYDSIKGDLEELYDRRLEGSKLRADLLHLVAIISLFRPTLIKSIASNKTGINMSILLNYLKTGFRNIRRQKVFSAINIIGLAVGLAAFLLINQYITYEQGYDSYFDNLTEIHRLSTQEMVGNTVDVKDAMSAYPLAKVVSEEVPEVISSTVTYHFDPYPVRMGDNVFYEDHIVSADSNFLNIFTYEVVAGNPSTILHKPNELVLTKSKALELFGSTDVLGESLELLGGFNREFVVVGIIEDVPKNTHYYFEILLSDKSLVDRNDYNAWNWFNYYTYARINSNADLRVVKSKVDTLMDKYIGEGNTSYIDIHPVKDIYLESDFTYEPEIYGDSQAVSYLSIIAIIILIIAWVNYINLSTAYAVNRSKEVGVRKSIGAGRRQLIMQFFSEAFLINLIAALISLIIAQLLLPSFNLIAGKEIARNLILEPVFMKNLLLFCLLGTIVSGFYPALVLARFKPTEIFRSSNRGNRGSVNLRKTLVVVQFAASIILIAATIIVNLQVDFMTSADKGINTDSVVGFRRASINSDEQAANLDAFKEELRSSSTIMAVGATSNLPGGSSSDINSTTTEVKIVEITDVVAGTTYLQFNDDEFIETVEMTVLNGRNFDKERASDSSAIMVNEAFLRKMNIFDREAVLGKQLQWGSDDEPEKFEIIGVVKDFNRTSMKSSIEPTVYFPSQYPSLLVVKINPERYLDGISYIESKWKEFYPDQPLEFRYLDDRFARLYENDTRFGYTFATFSVLTLMISLLGLFGLASFMAVQRTKEIGVRRVLGASINRIITLFFKDYLLLLLSAAVIGIPMVYLILSEWLQSYAYHIDFPWSSPMIALVVVTVFALGVVGYLTYRVATLNPSTTLKYE